jgi:hypothetical protein
MRGYRLKWSVPVSKSERDFTFDGVYPKLPVAVGFLKPCEYVP